MERDRLDANQILATRHVLRDRKLNLRLLCHSISISKGAPRRSRKERRTICRPGALSTRQRTPLRTDTSRLEPHIARRLPTVDIRTIRHLRHVKLHGPEMRNARRSNEAQSIAGSNGSGTCSRTVLETAHVRTGDGCYAGVCLVVLGLADGGPFCGLGGAVDD
jgi:hypothetical protein